MKNPVPVLSNGLGVESVAILLRWILEPSTRDFDLEDLVVVTAMTGREWPDTIRNFETHVLPLFREYGIRYVQLGRGGHQEKDGIVVLDDSRDPQKLFASGAYTLYQELQSAGTVPQYGGAHHCSLKFKAFVIENWLASNIQRSVRHTFGYNFSESGRVRDSEAAIAARVSFGFNNDELGRVADARSYDHPTRIGHYPLVEWGWDRARCLSHIHAILGVNWNKSACPFCPFTQISGALTARQKEFPEETAQAMFLERVGLAMNPRAQLYKKQPLYTVVLNSGNQAAIEAFDQLMLTHSWALYRVRRIYKAKAIYEESGRRKRVIGFNAGKKGTTSRCVERLEEFASAEAANRRLFEIAGNKGLPAHELHGLQYLTLCACQMTYPTREEFLVSAPAVVETKARYGVEHFDAQWAGLAQVGGVDADGRALPMLEQLAFPDDLIQIT
ncbi:MAG TPA: hypothetical protein VFK06_17875 [Candidatus Angelobacter sp.]|nr:hypothetical protein [Candidatus Angelobacter sp.]